jgi:hypothetical protein
MGEARRGTEVARMGPLLVIFELGIIGAVLVSLALIVRIVKDSL